MSFGFIICAIGGKKWGEEGDLSSLGLPDRGAEDVADRAGRVARASQLATRLAGRKCAQLLHALSIPGVPPSSSKLLANACTGACTGYMRVPIDSGTRLVRERASVHEV